MIPIACKITYFSLYLLHLITLMVDLFALQFDGAANPSGLDLSAWRRLSTYFHSDSSESCNALATAICSSFAVCTCSFL